MCIKMKNDKKTNISPIVFGLLGGLAATAAFVVGALTFAAVFLGTDDPNSYVLISACIAVFLGGTVGGILSVKLSGAFISAVVSAVTSLLIMAVISMFVPESGGILSRVLPPMVLTVSTLLGGYMALGKKQTRADAVKKAAKKARK